MALRGICPGQLYDPDHDRSKPVRARQCQPYSPTCVYSLRRPRVRQALRDSKRLLTSPACPSPLRRPALLSQPIAQPATMVNTKCKGPIKDRLFQYHKRLRQIISALFTLSSGIHCLRTAGRPPKLCSTVKILRDMRLQLSLT